MTKDAETFDAGKLAKILFRRAVDAIGGQVPASYVLGISQSMVSRLASLNESDRPPFEYVIRLEIEARKPVATGEMSRILMADNKGASLDGAVSELAKASSELASECITFMRANNRNEKHSSLGKIRKRASRTCEASGPVLQMINGDK